MEVVQRPSKSWVRVQYKDHDWAKDTNRTLAITTYQFVKVSEIDISPQYDIQSRIGCIGISKTRLSGSGVSVVKIHFLNTPQHLDISMRCYISCQWTNTNIIL